MGTPHPELGQIKKKISMLKAILKKRQEEMN